MKRGIVVLYLSLFLLFLFCISAGASQYTDEQLKHFANRDVIKEYRMASAKALMIRYWKDGKTVEEWEKLVKSSNKTLQLAAAPYLAEAYKTREVPGKIEEAENLVKKLENKISDENQYIRKAAGMALGDLYGIFCLYEKEGYREEDLIKVLKGKSSKELKSAARKAIVYVYAQNNNLDQIEKMYKENIHNLGEDLFISAYALRLSSPLEPRVEPEKLKSMTENQELPSWIRSACGEAYGHIASDLNKEKLEEYALDSDNIYLSRGAGEAFSRSLINSDITAKELIKTIVASAGYKPRPYRKALENALAIIFAKSGV